MSMQANYFKLGLFVIISVGLLLTGVIVLGAGALFKKTIVFETYMTHSVLGLDEGSNVRFRGVRLGSVSMIELASKKYEPDFFTDGRWNDDVVVQFALPASDFEMITREQFKAWLDLAVSKGLRARMASSGLTGPAYLELVYLDPERFPPPEIRWTPPAFYIPSAPGTMQQIISAVDRILTSLQDVDIKSIIDDIKRAVNNADRLMIDAKDKVDELDVKSISDDAVALLEELRGSNARLREILDNPNIDPSIADLHATLENAKRITEKVQDLLADPRVDRIIGNIDETTEDLVPGVADLRRAIRRIDRLIATQQPTIEAALEELRKTLENVEFLTEDAKDNPSRILFGDPPPRKTPGGDQ